MIPYKHIRKIVVKGLKDYLKCPFIRYGQDGEPPAYPYGGFKVLTDTLQNNGTYGECQDGIARKPVKHSWSITFQSEDEEEAYKATLSPFPRLRESPRQRAHSCASPSPLSWECKAGSVGRWGSPRLCGSVSASPPRHCRSVRSEATLPQDCAKAQASHSS